LKNNIQKKIILINFFLILKSNGSLLTKAKKTNFIPIWNYYTIINNLNFDKNAFFLINNIVESINHNLNSKFKNKYPSFNEWEKTILEECEKYFSKNIIMKRNDYTTKILIFIL